MVRLNNYHTLRHVVEPAFISLRRAAALQADRHIALVTAGSRE
jgi:hypothetical protein